MISRRGVSVDPRKIDWTVVGEQDAERRAAVRKMIDADQLHTADDYFDAGLIFQHGDNTASRFYGEITHALLRRRDLLLFADNECSARPRERLPGVWSQSLGGRRHTYRMSRLPLDAGLAQ
jgi:hypothetical protein